MSHLDEGVLHAWLDGEVAPSREDRIRRHLEQCAACAGLLEAAARDRAAASELLGELGAGPRLLAVPGDAERQGSAAPAPAHATDATVASAAGTPGGWRALGWAASVVLALALGWFARPVSAPMSVPDPTPAGPAAESREAARLAAEAGLASPAPDALTDAAEAAFPEPPPVAVRQRAAPPAAERAGAAAQAEALPLAGLPLATPPDAAAWLGRDPLLPDDAEVTRIELLPAGSVPGSRGAAPVVLLQLRLPGGVTARVYLQRLDGAPGAAELRATGEGTDQGVAEAEIGGLLVRVEGAAAARVLARLRQSAER